MNVYSSRTLQCLRCMPVGHAHLFASVFPGMTFPDGSAGHPPATEAPEEGTGVPRQVWDRMRSVTAAGNWMVPSEENFAMIVAEPTSAPLRASFAAHCREWPFPPDGCVCNHSSFVALTCHEL